MKRVWLILGILFLMCGCEQIQDPVVGVTRERAADRKSRVTNLKYNLYFNIPLEQEKAVQGKNVLTFELSETQGSKHKKDLWLDFTGQVKQLVLNGQQIPVEMISEHLRLPGDGLRPGKNQVEVHFVSPDQSLNRRPDFMYTLLVPDRARTLFPCFDQPNLKGRYTLGLSIPESWGAVANGKSKGEVEDPYQPGKKIVRFFETEPLSTYLFSFVVGEFEYQEFTKDRTIGIYHRETDPAKLKQLPVIAEEVFASLAWLEAYTAVPYPFAKYDLIILPGFQYGGMEHTGATLYNASRMFLEANPSVKERMSRSSVIAHETAHMWFGDYVTMSWFDDVWIKEVFANYFAAEIIKEWYPDYDDRLNFTSYHLSAYAEERTTGTVSLSQPLGNLKDAGLIYSNIIYNKAPIVMSKLVERMGEKSFQVAVQQYLKQYAYGNSTWEELIAVFDAQVPIDMVGWSDVWVASEGAPRYKMQRRGDTLTIRQIDPLGRDLSWDQSVLFAWQEPASNRSNRSVWKTQKVVLADEVIRLVLPAGAGPVLPNADAMGYGVFVMDTLSRNHWLETLPTLTDDLQRRALLTNFQELFWMGKVSPMRWATVLMDVVEREQNQLLFSQALNQLTTVLHWYPELTEIEQRLLQFAAAVKDPVKGRLSFLALMDVATTSETRAWLLEQSTNPAWSLKDRTQLIYRLAIFYPEQAIERLSQHRTLLDHPDLLAEFDFLARAVHPDPTMRAAFFEDLKQPAFRVVEPWVSDALRLLGHPERQQEALAYLRTGLEMMPEIQQTGDIFFPKNWAGALLYGHTSLEAKRVVLDFLHAHKSSMHPLLLSKVRQQADGLLRMK